MVGIVALSDSYEGEILPVGTNVISAPSHQLSVEWEMLQHTVYNS